MVYVLKSAIGIRDICRTRECRVSIRKLEPVQVCRLLQLNKMCEQSTSNKPCVSDIVLISSPRHDHTEAQPEMTTKCRASQSNIAMRLCYHLGIIATRLNGHKNSARFLVGQKWTGGISDATATHMTTIPSRSVNSARNRFSFPRFRPITLII